MYTFKVNFEEQEDTAHYKTSYNSREREIPQKSGPIIWKQ